ncbi:MAG: hypothetical protein GWO20_03760 [Candidatus Korarchaeota archaeon]|nr:hypothetical protein [Candidatus Korarchaeota archaeon]NIU82530.1 hypothetical protein [Candidatus Thorarchaeota archaeon]
MNRDRASTLWAPMFIFLLFEKILDAMSFDKSEIPYHAHIVVIRVTILIFGLLVDTIPAILDNIVGTTVWTVHLLSPPYPA